MKNIFNYSNKTVRAFTLIELMVVVAIIGIMATVMSAPIQTYLKKSRDSKKIADMTLIKDALGQYAVDHGGAFPSSITTGSPLYPDYLPSVPGNSAVATSNRDKYMYVTCTDTTGVSSYHLGVNLEFQNSALGVDNDSATLSCGGTLSFTNRGTTAGAVGATGPAGGTALGTSATDFNGVDDGNVCSISATGVSNCVYDIVP